MLRIPVFSLHESPLPVGQDFRFNLEPPATFKQLSLARLVHLDVLVICVSKPAAGRTGQFRVVTQTNVNSAVFLQVLCVCCCAAGRQPSV